MVADSLPPYGWSRNTFFKLVLINQVDNNKSIEKGTQVVEFLVDSVDGDA